MMSSSNNDVMRAMLAITRKEVEQRIKCKEMETYHGRRKGCGGVGRSRLGCLGIGLHFQVMGLALSTAALLLVLEAPIDVVNFSTLTTVDEEAASTPAVSLLVGDQFDSNSMDRGVGTVSR